MRLRVMLNPGAGANRIDCMVETPDGSALKVRVTAIPEKGKANAALIKLLAKELGIAKGRFEVVTGPKDRRKVQLIRDANPADLEPLERYRTSTGTARSKAG